MKSFVLIPGLNCTGDLYAEQIPTLERHGTVVVADTTRDDTIAGMAERLLAQAPASRLSLVGLSMGGYVALEALRRAPERVERIALLDTSARADTPEAMQNRERLIALARSGRFDEVIDGLWPRLVAPERLGDAALRARVEAMARAIGPDAFVRQQRAIIARRDQRDLLPGIEIPTLVLVGAQDVVTPPELADEIAEPIEWASLVRVPECGHLSTMERPEAVCAALDAWIGAD